MLVSFKRAGLRAQSEESDSKPASRGSRLPETIPGGSVACYELQLFLTDAGAAMELDKSLQISTLPHFPIIPSGAPVSAPILPTMALLASEIKGLAWSQAIQARIGLAGRVVGGYFSTEQAQLVIECGVVEQLSEVFKRDTLLWIDHSVQAVKRKHKFIID
jgi:hypothetical protein